MHARLTRLQGSADRIDDLTRQMEEKTVPYLRGLDGFRGGVVLADRSSGTQITISYWESEDAMRASEQAVTQTRRDAADTVAVAAEPVVERYEVTFQA